MKKSLLALLIAGLSSTAFAQANDQFYVEVGYGAIKYTEPGAWAEPGVGVVRLGMNIDKNLSGELMYGGTVNDANFYVGSTRVTFRYDSIYGAYLKGKLEVSPFVEVFGRVGVTGADVSASVPGYAITASGSDVSYGAGVQFNFSKTAYGQIDYMSYYNKGGASVKGPSASVGFRF